MNVAYPVSFSTSALLKIQKVEVLKRVPRRKLLSWKYRISRETLRKVDVGNTTGKAEEWESGRCKDKQGEKGNKKKVGKSRIVSEVGRYKLIEYALGRFERGFLAVGCLADSQRISRAQRLPFSPKGNPRPCVLRVQTLIQKPSSLVLKYQKWTIFFSLISLNSLILLFAVLPR